MSELSLNLKSTMVSLIMEDEHFQKHFEVSDSEEVWNKIENVTDEQYNNFFKQNLYNKHYFKLNGFLEKLGFKRKEQ